MCRVLTYLGEPIALNELLYLPDNSLIKQSFSPKMMPHHMLNLGGFGLSAWERDNGKTKAPFIYRTPTLPFYDENLKHLSDNLSPHCLIAHVRGVEYSPEHVVSQQNAHPFLFNGTDIAFAHNGSLVGFSDIRFEMTENMKPEFKKQIKGTTDSEWMYALFLSQLPQGKTHGINEVMDGLLQTFDILQYIRSKHQQHISSPLNFFISNGSFLVCTRYILDYGHYGSSQYTSPHMIYHSLWYTYGERYGFYDEDYKMKLSKKKKCILIASEPLTEDSTTWIEVPEYSFISASVDKGVLNIRSLDVV